MGTYDTIDYSIPPYPNITRLEGAGLIETIGWQDATSGEAFTNNKSPSAKGIVSSGKVILGQLKNINSSATLKATSTLTILADAEVDYMHFEQTILSDAELTV